MDKQDYTATIWVEQSPQEVFDAAKNFRAWWSEEIEGSTEKPDEVFFYHYKDVHLCKIKLIDLITIGKGHPNPKEGDGFNARIVRKWKLK